jgi:hypothetical protein
MAASPLDLSIARSIQVKFQALYDAYGDLRDEVVHLHTDLQVTDGPTRNLFSDLSRILAFSDNLHLTLSIMREDVKAMESMVVQSEPAAEDWWEAHANEWLQAMESGTCKVH